MRYIFDLLLKTKAMNQKDVLNGVRALQKELKDMEEGYKLGLYTEHWYNEHIKGLKAAIETKKSLFKSVYSIHGNI